MEIKISNEITIHDPTDEVRKWIYDKLRVPNPDYENKLRLGLWLGNTPEYLCLYRNSGDNVIVPYGVRKSLFHAFPNLVNVPITCKFAENKHVNYNADIKLYDYQENAVNSLIQSEAVYCKARQEAARQEWGL